MNSTSGGWWKVAIWVGLVLLSLWFFYAVRSVLLPFALAFIIAILLEPLIQKLRARGLSRGFAVTLVFLTFFGVVGIAAMKAIPMASTQINGLVGSVRRIVVDITAETQAQSVFVRWNPTQVAKPDSADRFDKFLVQYKPWLDKAEVPSTRTELIKKYVEPNQKKISEGVRGFFGGFLGMLGGAISQIFLLLFTPIFTLMILGDMETLKVRSISWIPPSIRRETVGLMQDVGNVLISYLRGVTTSIMVYTALATVVLLILGVPYGILLALIFGSIYVIPYLGGVMILATVFLSTWLSGTTKCIIFSSADPMQFAMIITAVYAVFHFGYDNLINPMFIGKAVGLNPLVSMFVIFCGGALFGLVGMIISYPIAGVVKVVLQRLLKITGTATKETVHLPAIPLRHRS